MPVQLGCSQKSRANGCRRRAKSSLHRRRLVGVDWLAGPSRAQASPRRIVFGSLKGGVGRTTALCVAAADLARQGKNVLVVDLDLEAAGVGSLLLPQGSVSLPRYGTLDYLAESCVDEDPSKMISELVGISPLTSQHSGRVDVAPVAAPLQSRALSWQALPVDARRGP